MKLLDYGTCWFNNVDTPLFTPRVMKNPRGNFFGYIIASVSEKAVFWKHNFLPIYYRVGKKYVEGLNEKYYAVFHIPRNKLKIAQQLESCIGYEYSAPNHFFVLLLSDEETVISDLTFMKMSSTH